MRKTAGSYLLEKTISKGWSMETELRALVAHLENCWNRFDSESWASVFAEDADFIHILGAHYSGRESVEKGHRLIFDTIYKGSHNRMEVEKIRPLRDDVAVVFTQSILEFFQGGSKVTIKSRPTLVANRKNGKWEIVAFQNTLQKEAVSDDTLDRLVKAHPFPGAPAAEA
jgi:uncharacterized protein (TIGR02246 family)